MLQGESEYMHKFNTFEPNGYNRFDPILRIGFHNGGIKFSDEHNKNMGKTKIGNKNWLDKHHSKESKEKNRKSHLGKKPWNKNKRNIYSEETLEKMRKSHIGKRQSDESIKQGAEKRKGQKRTKETCNNISKSLIGRSFFDEHLENIKKSANKEKECEYCHKIINVKSYNRWHGNNCKYKN